MKVVGNVRISRNQVELYKWAISHKNGGNQAEHVCITSIPLTSLEFPSIQIYNQSFLFQWCLSSLDIAMLYPKITRKK